MNQNNEWSVSRDGEMYVRNDSFDQIRDDVVCGVIPPPPGFERYAPDYAGYDEWLERLDAENDYDERRDR